jgi:hypothetical protein
MRKTALLAAVVCLISCYGMNAFGQTSHYVGASSTITNGAAGGTARMNTLCVNTFGAAAHMCNVDEFIETSPLAGKAGLWAQPKFNNCYVDSTTFAATCYENGLGWDTPSNISASCDEWQSTGVYGTIVTNLSGSTFNVSDTEPCSKSHYVACCSPEN